MKGTHLGEFEELIILATAALQKDAYGLAIKKELEEQSGRKITISAVHASCNRLETKGFLTAEFGEKSDRRGGKRKKIYTVSLKGQQAVYDTQALRMRLWKRIPPASLDLKISW